MLKNTCCSICLSINKRTVNIYGTDLHYVYENLVNLKIRDNECWMCYICFTRLRQCQQLKQLAVQTRGLIEDVFQNKINVKLGHFGSLLELMTSRTKTFSTTHPHYKQEADGETEFYYDNSNYDDGAPTVHHIKLESEVKTECCSDDDDIENTQNCEVVLSNADENGQTCADDRKEMRVRCEIKQEIEVEIGDTSSQQDTTNDSKVNQNEPRSKKQLVCSFCFKTFAFKSKLQNHIRIHTGEKPYTCDICSRSFSHKCHLIIHIRTHTDEKPFGCDMCTKRFSQKRYLDEHTSGHTGNKSFRCDVCAKTFTRKNNMKTHMRTHMQSTPFVCDICSKNFIQGNHLDVHMRIHTGVKPYSCHVCLKKFSTTGSLNKHKLIHTRVKTFSCNVCSKKFLRKGHLTDHLLTHRGDQPHSCNVCLKRFSRKSTLKRHTKNHCGEED